MSTSSLSFSRRVESWLRVWCRLCPRVPESAWLGLGLGLGSGLGLGLGSGLGLGLGLDAPLLLDVRPDGGAEAALESAHDVDRTRDAELPDERGELVEAQVAVLRGG